MPVTASHNVPKPPETSHKAVVAAVVAGLAALLKSLTDSNPVSVRDWVFVVVSAIVAGLAVYAVPNRPKR